MSPALLDLFTAIVFFGALLGGWGVLKLRERQQNSPQNRVRDHLHSMLNQTAATETVTDDPIDAELFQHYRQESAMNNWIAARLERLKTVCSNKLQTYVTIVVAASLTLMVLLIWGLPMNTWWGITAVLLSPALVTWMTYLGAVERFKKRFLAQFPDTIDLIIRAVRAGVPANKAISAAGNEFPDPVKTEFGLMGDGLRLGIDLKDVLDEADMRIGIPEFSFFCVCLQLQRETGGQLTETLENLAQIIRSRRELAMKARALTGETRNASKMIAAIPAFIVGVFWFIDKDYISPLFYTSRGVYLFKIALGMIGFGLWVIRKMSDLKV
jgi:Flp pilus assembly protein TadB